MDLFLLRMNYLVTNHWNLPVDLSCLRLVNDIPRALCVTVTFSKAMSVNLCVPLVLFVCYVWYTACYNMPSMYLEFLYL